MHPARETMSEEEPGTGRSDQPTGRPAPARRVLVLASRFPPVASVGAIRVRKFVRYLGRFGWQPVVITGAMRQEPVFARDVRRAVDLESLADLPPDLPVYRLSPTADFWPGPVSRHGATLLSPLTSWLGWDETRWAAWLKWRGQRLHDALAFPDRGIWRLPPAVRLALALHRQYRFDAIFSSGMPFSDHVIALLLQALVRRPWLADFRDPWVEYIHWQQWYSDWGGRLTRASEAAVVRRASSVISVNDHMTRRFRSRYPGAPSGKFVTIENGFDPADFPAPSPAEPHAQFRLVYAGSLYQTRSPQTVLEAFERFRSETPGSRERARFDFAGRAGSYVEEIANWSNDGAVRYLGMLPHAAALREITAADVNVIILPNVPGSENDTTAKIYECLGSGRPILAAVPPDGAAAAVLRRHDGVWLCDPDDVESIARAMGETYRRWVTGTLAASRSTDSLRTATREYQTKQLAACLDAAVSHRRHAAVAD